MHKDSIDPAAVLAQWQARAAEVRSRLAPPGVRGPSRWPA